MYLSKQLKESNIAEYLLYMWQVEDLIRANGCDPDRLHTAVVSRYPAESQAALDEWYANLVEMMRAEGVKERGHLQINRNVMLQLTETHAELLGSTDHPFYNAAYFKALPFIVELRHRAGDEGQQASEIELCFDALYGVLMLKLQQKPLTEGTANAMEAISHLIALLAKSYAEG